MRESLGRCVDHRDGELGASDWLRAAPMSFAIGSSKAASRLEGVGNAYQLATLFCNAAGSSLRRSWDDDATIYLQRAVPLIKPARSAVPVDAGAVQRRTRRAPGRRPRGRQRRVPRSAHAQPRARRPARRIRRPHGPRCESQCSTTNWSAPRGLRVPRRRIATAPSMTSSVGRLDATILEPARTRFGAGAWDAALREGAALEFSRGDRLRPRRAPRLASRGGEVHVVLGVAGPGAAPAPADRAERRDRARGHHPLAVAGAVAVAPRLPVAALPASDVGVFARVDVHRQAVGVLRPGARAAPT